VLFYQAQWLRLGPREVGETSSNDDVDIQYARWSIMPHYLEARAFSSDVLSRQKARLC